MRNPNQTTTSMTTSSDKSVITFQYTSASVCKADFQEIKNSYASYKVEQIAPKIITVTIPR
jgi:hypothetical protein